MNIDKNAIEFLLVMLKKLDLKAYDDLTDYQKGKKDVLNWLFSIEPLEDNAVEELEEDNQQEDD